MNKTQTIVYYGNIAHQLILRDNSCRKSQKKCSVPQLARDFQMSPPTSLTIDTQRQPRSNRVEWWSIDGLFEPRPPWAL